MHIPNMSATEGMYVARARWKGEDGSWSLSRVSPHIEGLDMGGFRFSFCGEVRTCTESSDADCKLMPQLDFVQACIIPFEEAAAL